MFLHWLAFHHALKSPDWLFPLLLRVPGSVLLHGRVWRIKVCRDIKSLPLNISHTLTDKIKRKSLQNHCTWCIKVACKYCVMIATGSDFWRKESIMFKSCSKPNSSTSRMATAVSGLLHLLRFIASDALVCFVSFGAELPVLVPLELSCW